MSESAVASQIRVAAAYANCEIWRNNVGVLKDERGVPVRYGLANDSKKLNKEIKSSDLIGITPVLITQEMVGTVVGVFTAIETKREDWKFNQTDEHSLAQKRFHDIVLRAGGFAGFANCVNDFLRIIRK